MRKNRGASKCEKGEFKSCFEYRFAQHLLENKLKFKYEPVRLKYTLPARYYKPDWEITTKRGKLYIETKGYLDAEDKLLLRTIKEQHPEIDIRLVFEKANKKFHKASPTTYADWADKNGFLWAEKEIPKEWLD